MSTDEGHHRQDNPPAAWYVDPGSTAQIRYWDGHNWTNHVAPLDTVADLHTGHFESVRTEKSASLGLASGSGVLSRTSREKSDPKGARFDSAPPELGKGWFVAEGLSLEPEGILTEHIVVSASGVFLLMSRNHSDSEIWLADRSFLVDGKGTDYLREASVASRALTVMLRQKCGFTVGVEPVIIVKAKRLTIKAQPLNAHVVDSNLFGRWITRLEPILLPSAVQRISEAIGAHSSTAGRPANRSGSEVGDTGRGGPTVDLTDSGDAGSRPTAARTFSSAGDEPEPAPRRSLFS